MVKRAFRDAVWRHFATWCQARGLRPLPAHPWTVAAYARSCERRHPAATIAKRVRAIARVHLLQCETSPDRHPMVTRTLRVIEARKRRRHLGAALFNADDFMSEDAAPTVKKERISGEPSGAGGRHALRHEPRLVSRRPRSD